MQTYMKQQGIIKKLENDKKALRLVLSEILEYRGEDASIPEDLFEKIRETLLHDGFITGTI